MAKRYLIEKKYRQKWGWANSPEFIKKPPKHSRDNGWGGGAHYFSVWDKDGGHHEYVGWPEVGYTKSNYQSPKYIIAMGKLLETPQAKKNLKKMEWFYKAWEEEAKRVKRKRT